MSDDIKVECFSCKAEIVSDGVEVKCSEGGCDWRQVACAKCGGLLMDPANPIALAVKDHTAVHNPYLVIRLNPGEQKGETIGHAKDDESIKALLKPDHEQHPDHDYAILNRKTGQWVKIEIGSGR